MQDAAETVVDEDQDAKNAQRALLALLLLDDQHTKLETQHSATKKEFADKLSKATDLLNTRIRDALPSKSGDCKQQLKDVQELDAAREQIKSEKAKAIEKVKAQIAENQAAFYEILRRRKNPAQTHFNFGHGDGSTFDPHAGLLLDAKHIDQVRQAAEEYEGEAAGMEDLNARLDEIGAAGITFPDIGTDDEEEEGDDENGDGDESGEGPAWPLSDGGDTPPDDE